MSGTSFPRNRLSARGFELLQEFRKLLDTEGTGLPDENPKFGGAR